MTKGAKKRAKTPSVFSLRLTDDQKSYIVKAAKKYQEQNDPTRRGKSGRPNLNHFVVTACIKLADSVMQEQVA